ncbi:MAG TPA: hypothetical protein DEP01_07100 [Aminobacterium sp.]|nr:hypothetical protein [Aminobacterium sp.]
MRGYKHDRPNGSPENRSPVRYNTHIRTETDAPWLAPQHHRGKRNEPSFVTEVYDVVAEVRGISVEELKRVVWRNAYSLFQWEDQ